MIATAIAMASAAAGVLAGAGGIVALVLGARPHTWWLAAMYISIVCMALGMRGMGGISAPICAGMIGVPTAVWLWATLVGDGGSAEQPGETG